MEETKIKQKILIADDSEMNRSILTDMLGEEFDILEASDGLEAIEQIEKYDDQISLVLLDIVMPNLDGFGVLAKMNEKHWIQDIPVIIISSENASSFVERGYELGATDYIQRPFDTLVVRRRSLNTIMLYGKQKALKGLIEEQIYKREKEQSLMIDILSHAVEFRNGESGMHVLHVHTITEMLLNRLVQKTDKYPLTQKQIHLIGNASALHDIGKISIPAEILNKPGRFTPEEFAIMKAHTVEGAKMLGDIPFRRNEALIKVGYEICRWHHERYDGGGYPDGLKGDEIPIAAQVVSMADVYDALTSERVYKPAYTHEEALAMIAHGECGAFNPLLLECLQDISDALKQELHVMSFGHATEDSIRDTVTKLLKTDGSDVSQRSIQLLEHERMKFRFLSDISRELIFEYIAVPEMIKLSEWSAESLGVPEKILDPANNPLWTQIFSAEDFADLMGKLRATTPENSVITAKYILILNRDKTWCKVIVKALWSEGETPELEGAIGKIVDVNAETAAMNALEQKADHDSRTGLLNHNAAKKRIGDILANAGGRKYALAVFDLDNFKQANDVYGHLFGDEVLEEVAIRMKNNIRSTDIAARMGGDEFILFMEYKDDIEPQIQRVFKRLTVPHKQFAVGVSMGIATTENFTGTYEELFARADAAMYDIKRDSKNCYKFYREGMPASPRE